METIEHAVSPVLRHAGAVRAMSLASPLPPGDLAIETLQLDSGLSQLGEMQLGLLSPRADLKAEALLGKPVTVTIELRDGAKRHLNGHVSRFGIGTHRGRHFGYQATVKPWLWFLTRTTDCRIFQEMTVPDIVKKVFGDHRIANYEFKLFRKYRQWVYCVQYRESDFNFVARLLEHEGIYWYFSHAEGSHKLVLVDSLTAHDATPGYEALPYFQNTAEMPPDLECVSDWQSSRSVRPGKVTLASYDFERPSADLAAEYALQRGHDLADYELFDFQGDYCSAADGLQWAEDRVDEMAHRHSQVRGVSNARGLAAGRVFALERHPRADQNIRLLLTHLSMRASVDALEAGGLPGQHRCEFTGIPADVQFRPPRRTPKPTVKGPQTAVVVGPAGEEIYTDKYGRVKVQFHWDRYGRRDQHSSCWIRVSHPWAGKNFGIVDIPRIGQEVVVDFLEGDPDQPLITGRVYNGEQMVPWDLPANATQSGILTRSSKGGGYDNANAIRFEDKKGSEQLWIHAEKNQDIEVENDETHTVGHDRKKDIGNDETTSVGHDRTETVGHDETISIGVDRTETVGSNETISIGANRTETVGADETITIAANRTETVGADETISIGANRTETVGSNETVSIGSNQTFSVGANRSKSVAKNGKDSIGKTWSIKVGKFKTETIGMAYMQNVGLGRVENVGLAYSLNVGAMMMTVVGMNKNTKVVGNQTVDVGKVLKLKAAKSIELVCGGSRLVLTPDAIFLEATDIHQKAANTVNIDGPSDVHLNSGTAAGAPA